MPDDQQLLRRYADDGSEAAFGELVARYVNLVYSAALRRTGGDADLAKDVAQLVFTDLARKARALPRGVVLAGWLHRATRYAAAQSLRTERRRQAREQEAVAMNALRSGPAPDWDQIRPLLDDALDRLDRPERDALVLRFFEQRSLAEVGRALGANEDTARKRVSRALDRLRADLSRRGLTTTAAALATAISANAVQVVPAGLAATLTSASLAGAAAGTGTTLTFLKLMAMTKLKAGIIGALVVAGVATPFVVQHLTQQKLGAEIESLQQQIADLQAENENLSKRMARAADSRSVKDDQVRELLRLRGEVGLLRRQTNELQNSLARARNPQPQELAPAAEPPPASGLPEDYPKTADGATKGIFEAWGRGDWDTFLANFAQPGVPREHYDQMFNDQIKSNLAGMEIVSLGQPTNGFSSNHWFVPYKIRFRDGGEKDFRLSVKQDPKTQRFYFDGGF